MRRKKLKNSFVLNNFNGTSRMLAMHEGVPDQELRDSLYKFFATPESNELSHEMKKDYASLLLTGCVLETRHNNKGALKNIAAVDMDMSSPVACTINSVVTGVKVMYDVFSYSFHLMVTLCPDLLKEIIEENYERIMPGSTKKENNFGERLAHANHFYQPILEDILEKYAGREVRYNPAMDSPLLRFIYASIDGLLRFGKSGYFGISLPVLMACIGVYTERFPDILDEKLKVVSESFSKNKSGNGLKSLNPSMTETAHIIELIDRQCSKACKRKIC